MVYSPLVALVKDQLASCGLTPGLFARRKGLCASLWGLPINAQLLSSDYHVPQTSQAFYESE